MHGTKTQVQGAPPRSRDLLHKVLSGRYGPVELTERYEGARPPGYRVLSTCSTRKARTFLRVTASTRPLGHTRDGRPRTPGDTYSTTAADLSLVVMRLRAYVPKCQYRSRMYRSPTTGVRIEMVAEYRKATYKPPTIYVHCRKEPAIEVFGYGTERLRISPTEHRRR